MPLQEFVPKNMSRVNTLQIVAYLEHAVDHLLEGLDALLLAAIDQVVQVRVLGKNVIRMGCIPRAPDLPQSPERD